MPVPVVTVAQMREWEELSWQSGCLASDVMSQAGKAVSQKAVKMSRVSDVILFLVGPGNNGGDARLAAEHLFKREIQLVEVKKPKETLGKVESLIGSRPALIVDGLFGIGLNRSLDDSWIKIIDLLNDRSCPLLAVDIPSGLNADTGKPMRASVQADVTVTFGAPKIGLTKDGASKYTGRLEVADNIGLVDCPSFEGLQWITKEDFANYPPERSVSAHKGDFGHLGILAGSCGWHGAAILAARAAIRAQPGLVTVVTTEDAYLPVACQLAQPMVHPWSKKARDTLNHCTAILMGPGLAGEIPSSMRLEISRIWQESVMPVIVDASALDLLTESETPNEAVRVITPHPGEAARMLDMPISDIQADRPAALRMLAQKYNCQVVLKGLHTLTGSASGEIFLNSSGNPYLAQGGSGDVLAGFLGGILAQPKLIQTLDRAISYAIWRHGEEADRLPAQAEGWGMDELIGQLK